MERATGTEIYGCGSTHTTDITLNIQTTTGGNFSISLNGKNTVEHLKKLVSKRLKVSKDRICLLHRERQLRDGTLEENGLLDGSRVILLPSVETGLLSQRPENSVMQALESLNDTQVNDFLSGKSPLNLTMRLGDHMMLIQLQLSTLNPTASCSSARTIRTSGPLKTSQPSIIRTTGKCESSKPTDSQSTPKKTAIPHSGASTSSPFFAGRKLGENEEKPVLRKQDILNLQNAFELFRSIAEIKNIDKIDLVDPSETSSSPLDTSGETISDASTDCENEQSPIKSLSNLVSSPIHTTSSDGEKDDVPTKCVQLPSSLKANLIDMLSSAVINNCSSSSELQTDVSSISDAFEAGLESCMCSGDESKSACNGSCVTNIASHTSDSSHSEDTDSAAEQSSFLSENTVDEYPMENLFNNAVDGGLFEESEDISVDREISNLATMSHGSHGVDAAADPLPSFHNLSEPLKNKRLHYLLHKTSKYKHPISQNKQKAFMQSVVNKHIKKRMQNSQEASSPQPSTSRTEPYVTSPRKLVLLSPIPAQAAEIPQPSTSRQTVSLFKTPDVPRLRSQPTSPTPPIPDTKALIEASKNLTQTLKKLSKEVLTNKVDLSGAEESVRSKVGPGAVIESMKHHGKGIYSGTFSGTLNPALQDRYGRPKRDISTIIHILNDLLCATPPITVSQKESKHTCVMSTSDKNKTVSCSQPSCAYGQCDGHSPSAVSTADKVPTCHCHETKRRAPCHCKPRITLAQRLLSSTDCPKCSGALECDDVPDMCSSCNKAKALSMENSKTKCKLEQLRLVMQQKKERREARKLKAMPYPPSAAKALGPADQSLLLPEGIDTVA